MKLWVVILVASIKRFLSNLKITEVSGSHWIVMAGSKVTIRGLTETSSCVRSVSVGVRGA